MTGIKKFVAIGPESTGKSTLCALLANHYGSIWCQEYARSFLEKTDSRYNYEDLLTIAAGQIRIEEVALQQARSAKVSPVFIDTDMQVMRVWCEFVFGNCHQFILDQIAQRSYDGYLLCETDLPWEPDPMREYPDHHVREELFLMYHALLSAQKTPWVIINGDHDRRLKTAVDFVDTIQLSNISA